jgi:hypothetical protein
MRYWIGWIIVGALWGLASIGVWAFFGTTPSDFIHEIVVCPEYYATHNSLIVRYFSTDWPPGFFKLIYLPHALGMDILAWTLGFGVRLFTRQGSPYSILGHLLDPHPVLAGTAVVVFNMLAGILVMTIPALFLRLLMWLGDLSNRPSRSQT